ncbi:MAG: Asp-tRNA(Asn)/Glu-tRNA(Gln) amidotransferase subunit GatC [Planctomycetota bacterium]|nr:Asp-tRNA(Asn)/Glu-tRNA(Gln) amidotransferase subunit GatC [Planctomycetota bacterium]
MADLTPEDIHKIARLSRLEVAADEVSRYQADLGAVLGWMDRLGELDLSGVEPMTRAETTADRASERQTPESRTPERLTADGSSHKNRLAADVPGPVLANDAVMGLAPEAMPPFFRVPRVLGDRGGA